MNSETVYHINTDSISKLAEAIDAIIADAGREARIRDVYFNITVEAP